MSRALWALVAALVFSCAAYWTYAPIWTAGAALVAPAEYVEGNWTIVRRQDAEAAAAIVARGAYTLVHHPFRYFDAEYCAPTEKSLAFGPAMLTTAILGIPGYLATGDPLLTFNVALVAYSLISCVAMYLLIVEWTGVPAAGIVAGLLFAFHPIRMTFGIPLQMDLNLAWAAFALLFAQRLFAYGRWRDAVGLAVAVPLQIWESMYTLAAAMFVCAPFAVWLLVRYRFRNVRPAQLAFAVAAIVLAAALFFAPYMEVQSRLGILQRTDAEQGFTPWAAYLPGGGYFLGWSLIVLTVCALVLGRRRTVGAADGADPRWILLAGGLCVALVAAGPYNNTLVSALTGNPSIQVPNLYRLAGSVIPGLNSLRKITCLSSGVHLAACVLAGMGAAGLIRVSKRYGTVTAAVLVLVATLDVTRPSALGLPPTYRWDFHSIAAEKDSIQFFRTLERLGNTGPVIELPVDLGLMNMTVGMARISLSFYHHRRTSACMGSYRLPGREELIQLANRLPARDAVNEIRRLGFTTAIIDPVASSQLLQRFLMRAQHSKSGVRLVYSNKARYAFALELVEEPNAPKLPGPSL